MGCNFSGISRSALDSIVYQPPVPRPPNPDPYNYRVLRAQTIQDYLIMEVQYPDATNYEGRKILLFDRGVTEARLKLQGAIDPHFSDSVSVFHPIARFEPTERGWSMVTTLCNGMTQ